MASKLQWTTAGPYRVASTRHRDKAGVAYWRIRRLPNGRWCATDSTPWLMGEDGLERWPMFDSAEMAQIWCEAADELLVRGRR